MTAPNVAPAVRARLERQPQAPWARLLSSIGVAGRLSTLVRASDLTWVVVLVLVAGGLITAHSLGSHRGTGATGTTNLSRPTNDIPPICALGAFHRVRTHLRSDGKPEVLFLGAMVDERSAAEEWPLTPPARPK